jgi:hypothetical protein
MKKLNAYGALIYDLLRGGDEIKALLLKGFTLKSWVLFGLMFLLVVICLFILLLMI